MISSLARKRIVRFLVVGIFNTALCYAVYAGFLLLGLGYVLANFLALLVGILVGFRTHGAFVFGNRDGGRFVWFFVVWCIIYLCNIGLIALLIGRGLDAYWAGAISLVPVAMLSYLLQRNLVFARHTVWMDLGVSLANAAVLLLAFRVFGILALLPITVAASAIYVLTPHEPEMPGGFQGG